MRYEADDVLTPYGPPETIQALATTPVPPTTGDSWTATGSVAALPASIWHHAQSTLPDGRVIVSDGRNNNGAVNSVYIYVPSSNIWETVATVPVAAWANGQSTLSDGRIMISGGWNGSTYYASTYIYHLDTNVWTSASPMPTSFSAQGQSTLNDGKVLISGGYTGSTLNAVRVYDVSSNVWGNTPNMSVAVSAQGQSTLLNGNVLITGGGTGGGNGLRTTSYIYSPIGTGSWSGAVNFTTARDWQGQSTLFDGRVLISGGRINTSQNTTNTSYVYNDATNMWVNVSPMPASFYGHTQSALADGRVLISGGSTNGTSGINTVYIYTPTGWDCHRQRSCIAC